MNRIVALILLIIYTAFSTGVMVNVHYCMGKAASVKIAATVSDDACGTCGQRSMSCCNDEITVLKVNDLHFFTANNTDLNTPVTDIPAGFISDLLTPGCGVFSGIVTPASSPPLLYQPEIFLRNCNFRI